MKVNFLLALAWAGLSCAYAASYPAPQSGDFVLRDFHFRDGQPLPEARIHYLTLGQPLSTLSGGECQRIKLASELHKRGSIYVMDEPTTGLHLSDIGRLLTIMNRLVDGGNTVMVIEHHLDVIRNADWIIDMGPEGGNKGGMVIFEGTPRELLGAKHSLTSKYL